MSRAIGGEAEDRALREQTTAMIVRSERHVLQRISANATDAVMRGEAFVEQRPVRVEKLAQAPVALQHIAEKTHGLGDHAFLQIFVVFGVKHLVRREHSNAAQLQPLAWKA